MTADEPVEAWDGVSDFYEEDEPAEDIKAAWEQGEHVVTAAPPSPSVPVESREQPNFESRPMRAEDVNGQTWVRIWDAQRHAPFDEGKVIGYSPDPTVIIERRDGTHGNWVASLPWEHAEPPRGCYLCRPDNPDADEEGCADCDTRFFRAVAADPSMGHFRPQQWWRDYVADIRSVVAEQDASIRELRAAVERLKAELEQERQDHETEVYEIWENME